MLFEVEPFQWSNITPEYNHWILSSLFTKTIECASPPWIDYHWVGAEVVDLPLRDKHRHTQLESYSKVSNWLISFLERKNQLLGNYTACLCQKLHASYTNRKCTFHQNGQAKFHWMENSINLWRKKCDSHQLHSLWLGYHQVDQERLNT